jgi:hypothetical protein
MAQLTIQWVGDEPRTYEGTNSWAVTGEDENGERFTKTKLEIPVAAGKPVKGGVVSGELVPHPRLDPPMKLIELAGDATVATNGSTPSEATGSLLSDSNTSQGGSTVASQINRSVAFKGAVELAAAEIQAGLLKAEDVIVFVDNKTEYLLGIVENRNAGRVDPNDVPLDTAESVQADATLNPNPEEIF